MSARPYLNEASFPASSEETALHCLEDLRKSISLLLKEKVIDLPVMCNTKVSGLSLTPDHKILAQLGRSQSGRFRETIYFFLQVLDQKAPAYSQSDLETRESVSEFDIDGLGADCPANHAMPIVLCGLEEGVLMSLGSAEHWRKSKLSFKALLMGDTDLRDLSCANVFDEKSATSVAEDLRVENEQLILKNWDQLTNGAKRSDQVKNWLEDSKRERGLITVVMRAVKNACSQNYVAKGNLIKQLNLSGGSLVIFEIRAWHNGSNNVRLLFVRAGDGTVTYCYAGKKTGDNWYNHAIAHTRRVAGN